MAALVSQTLQNADCKVSSETDSSRLQPGDLSSSRSVGFSEEVAGLVNEPRLALTESAWM